MRYDKRFWFEEVFPILIIIVIGTVVMGGLAILVSKDIERVESEPCEYFKDRTIDNVPARCLGFFQE